MIGEAPVPSLARTDPIDPVTSHNRAMAGSNPPTGGSNPARAWRNRAGASLNCATALRDPMQVHRGLATAQGNLLLALHSLCAAPVGYWMALDNCHAARSDSTAVSPNSCTALHNWMLVPRNSPLA